MKTLLISYDLKGLETSDDYKKLIEYIKNYGTWAKPLYSQWFVRTEKTCTTVRDEIKGEVDSNDKVLVLDVTGINWSAYNLSKEVIEWMNEHL